MNILFLTIGRFESIEAHAIYPDLLRAFRDRGHEIYAINPHEKRTGRKTGLVHERGAHLLHLETGNVTGAGGLIAKGVAQMSLEPAYIGAIRRFFSDVKFDLVMYSTPPITFCRAVEFVKRRDGARSCLLLKDIFPQNAVDLGMMSKNGAKGLLYRYFRAREKRLYALSDFIGCMSRANVEYLIRHNPQIDPGRVDVCPNAVEVIDRSVDEAGRRAIREKYGIPQDRKVFVYGGNLGRAQGIPFVIECLKKCADMEEAFFLIVGGGEAYRTLAEYAAASGQKNMKLMERLAKDDYDSMVGACDVGLIFLDHRFTIPNFPSRLLVYMQARLPVLAATDPNTDIGRTIVEGGFGWWCESNDSEDFSAKVKRALQMDLRSMKDAAFEYLAEHFSAENACGMICRSMELEK